MNNYDDESHTYTIDGRPVPSITQALVEAGIVETKFYNEEGRDRGSFIHKASQYLDQKDLDLDSIPEDHKGFLDGYQEFKDCTGFEPYLHGIEKPLFHPVHYFGGTPDRWGKLNGSDVVLELKTGSISPWTAIQTAAQEILINFIEPALDLRRHALRLSKDGKWKLFTYNDPRDHAVFLAALQVSHWKRSH